MRESRLVLCFVAAFAWLTIACSSPRPSPVPSPGVDGYDEARLQRLVRSGLNQMSLGPCDAALLLGVLDDDLAGERLDDLLARSVGTNAQTACSELIAAARIVRMGRLGSLDLEAELRGPSPVARAIALRYSLGTQAPAQTRALIEIAVADPDRDVRIVAYRTAGALGDPELAATLASAAPVDETEGFWRCAALSRLQPQPTCPEPAQTRVALAPGEALPEDRCELARADITSERRRDALWFYLRSAFRQRVEPLDRIAANHLELEPCLLDESIEDDILSSPTSAIEDLAITAAGLLWRRHEPVGVVRDKRVELRDYTPSDLVRYCSTPRDCPGDSTCNRGPERNSRGICGRRDTAPVERNVSVYVTVGSNACWSFMDCPAFYTCLYPNPRSPYGICVY